MNCGKEIPNESRFCQHCGTGLVPASNQPGQLFSPAPASRIVQSNKRLSLRHTLDWQGECPACGLIHNSENTLCPNDGSPLVVAFDEFDRLLPVHSAGLRCLKDCGYRTHALPCNDDGALITGRNIRFGFRKFNVVAHNAIYIVMALIGIAAFAPIFVCMYWAIKGPQMNIVYLVYLFPLLLVANFFLSRVGQHWYPFRGAFTFADVEKAERLNGRLKSREESKATGQARRGL